MPFPPEQHDRPHRRGFLGRIAALGWTTGFAALLTSGVASALAGVRFLYPNARPKRTTRFLAGRPEDMASGDVVSDYRETHGVWIARVVEEGVERIVALSTACTHLGCITIWSDAQKRFKCPCHGSGFYATGVNYEGPAPRPLERYAVRLTDEGRIEVDKSRVFRQELGQWTDPASFVEVS